jgi:hypothetical protein
MYRIIKDNSVHKNRSSTAWKTEHNVLELILNTLAPHYDYLYWKKSQYDLFNPPTVHPPFFRIGGCTAVPVAGSSIFCTDYLIN